jgi:hypothetical protein
MLEDLLFEILHSDEKTKAGCFAKFPAKNNPVGLMPPGGMLMQFENEYQKPSTPIWNHRLDTGFRYTFSPKLAVGDFVMNQKQLGAVRQWEEDLAKQTAAFVERAKIITNIFPALEGYRPGQDRARIDGVISEVASDMEGTRRFYKWAVPKGFAPAPIVGRNWAVFRYIQVNLIADVEFLAKYGIDVNTPRQDRLENERVDLNYLLFALLAKGLATNDGPMKERFRLLCPEGLLIEPEKRSNPAEVVESSLE